MDDTPQIGNPHDGLGQPNPSTDPIVRRGQEALDRKRRCLDDWFLIAGAIDVGRTETMALVHTNKPTGKRYEHAMGKWLVANAFNVIDKCTRSHALECLKHRSEIEEWLATLIDGERFKLNHPTTVLRKWKTSTAVPDPSAVTKPSPVAKLKEANIELQERLYRAEREIERGGGDLWNKDDRAEDIADIMLLKLSANKAEKVFRVGLAKLKEKKAAAPKPAALDATTSADERKSLYATEETGAVS